jgi:hypothetical protein
MLMSNAVLELRPTSVSSGLILRSLQLHPRFEIFHTGIDEERSVLGCDVIEIVIRVCVSAFQRDLLHPSSG